MFSKLAAKFDGMENETSWLNTGEITVKDGGGLSGLGAWAHDGAIEASHAAAMIVPAAVCLIVICRQRASVKADRM